MPTVYFHGRVIPEFVQVSINGHPSVKWESPDIGLTMDAEITIENSQIVVKCELNKYTSGDFMNVYMRALDLARASVDLIAFATAHGLTVVLDYFVDASGAKSSLLAKDDSLPRLCTAFSLGKDFDQVYKIVLSDPSLFMALNDLIAAITLPHVSAVNCARAVEGLRHLIATPGSTDKRAWEEMRQTLQIDRAYLQLITDNSTDSRHGNRRRIEGAVTTEITRRSWTIMNRYLEFKKRGGQPLPMTEFPLLKG